MSGVLTIYATPIDAFQAEEMGLLLELASDLAFGIKSMRERAARTRAEEALRASEARYRALYEDNPSMYFTVDRRGTVLSVNPFGAEQLGYRPAELVGCNVLEVFHPDDRAAVSEQLAACLRMPNQMIRWEFRKLRKEGSVLWVREAARAVRQTDGRTVILIVCEDTTDRKQLEGQLLQSQKMEAIGRLAGGIAHDFNNLLTVILGSVCFLLESVLQDDPRLQDMEEIRQAAERAAALTRQLLAFSRQQVMQPRRIDLNRTINNLDKMLRRLIGEDVELQTVLSSAPAYVNADPGQIEQVLLNLAVNARDAMPHGGKLTIETSMVTLNEDYPGEHLGVAHGAYARLVVSDTGTGMNQELLAQIFEPFFTTKAEGKGTGLGLSTVYGIVRQSGGHIEVDSTPGQGSTFRIYLPEANADAKPATPRIPPRELSSGSETILLVEDEAMVRNMMRRILSKYGYSVFAAGTGAEALALSQQHPEPIHLLLTDLVLPGGINGWDLSKRLRASRPGIKVLCMSGHAHDLAVQREILEAGIPIFEKPFDPAVLVEKVREVVQAPSTD